MKEKIKYLMAVIFEADLDTIDDDASPDNMENWDSIHHMNLIVAIEEEFNIQFDDEEILQMMNLPLILEILKEKKINENSIN